MNELSLFSGAGGGLLATKHLLGWTTIGYVEIDEYCQAVLAQRIADGFLDPAPIFGDIRRFIREGYAETYQGVVDVITAGFPCQPWSQMGSRTAERSNNNLWPETIRCICLVRPKYVLLENVSEILNYEYMGNIFGEMAESGYVFKWDCIPAFTVGAPQGRDRVWIIAYDDKQCCKTLKNGDYTKQENVRWLNNNGLALAQKRARNAESRICRMDDALAFGLDRLRAIGNGQVPKVVEVVWKLLTER